MTERIDREIIGGHLLVIGGAEDKYNERRILRKFLELAGGDHAEVLIVPVASDFPEFAADVYTQAFRNLGVASPRVLRATSRQDVFQANADELLDGVSGVFMTGGDQMRLVSILGGTKFADKLRHMVRDTKIVLAGTSAGAAGMSTIGFFVVNIAGTLTRLYLIRRLGETFESPIENVLDFIGDYRTPLLVLSIALFAYMTVNELKRGKGELDSLADAVEDTDPEDDPSVR